MTRERFWLIGWSWLVVTAWAGVTEAQGIAATGIDRGVAEALTGFIEHERADKQIPSIMIALVDDQRVVWARGFGVADPTSGRAATADSVVRVGSISKLFTDLALMQWVESGKVDLDTTLRELLPDFRPESTFDTPITLRQILAHRAGLVREPPVGHYFDPTEPSLSETVASLNRTEIVYRPGERTKYSNAGIAVVGRVVEVLEGRPFAEAMDRKILGPLGMGRSSFSLTPELRDDLAHAVMWTYDGRTFDAPTFELSGLAPAGNLYSTVLDLGKFLAMLFHGGEAQGGRLIAREVLERMWEPQSDGRFGLGFVVGELDGKRRVGHSGAVYGYASELAALPEQKLGVAVVCTKDCTNVVAERIANTALRLMLAARDGRELPEPIVTGPVPPEVVTKVVGVYGDPRDGVEILRRGEDLFVRPRFGGERHRLRWLDDSMVVDDSYRFGRRLRINGDSLDDGGRTLDRQDVTGGPPPDAPERWRGLIGEYGWDHDVLYILERAGRLHALIEWFELYPLEEIEGDTFVFPPHGLYPGERLVFTRDESGRATRALLGGSVAFKRRLIDGDGATTFRIEPAKPVDQLRHEALAATPPAEPGPFRRPELVELTRLDPSIQLDIRYAGPDNFLGEPVYTQGRAFLQRPAAEALLRAHESLKSKGYGLLIHDAYRPWYVTRMFFDATRGPDRAFVADPSKGSRHNRGCAVDLSLYVLSTGKPVPMVGGYDEFSARSLPEYPGGTGTQRWHRDLLRREMEDQGFTVNEIEWWHFDHQDWPKYPILNLPFDQIEPAR